MRILSFPRENICSFAAFDGIDVLYFMNIVKRQLSEIIGTKGGSDKRFFQIIEYQYQYCGALPEKKSSLQLLIDL